MPEGLSMLPLKREGNREPTSKLIQEATFLLLPSFFVSHLEYNIFSGNITQFLNAACIFKKIIEDRKLVWGGVGKL